jgi:DNA repair exonuclease SbcCD ATPase subunit
MLSAKYQIKFDDEFNESIIAGGYDDLKYGNLSAGEKQRLDLSLVFAFLEIARMKNNVNSNLLVCDEMFGDLDFDGMEGIRLLFAKLKNDSNCVTVITHEDRIKELAESSYTVEKKKFSKLEKD